MSPRPTCSSCKRFRPSAGPLGRCELLGALVMDDNVACLRYEAK